jgi:hypothetical protein
MDKKQILDLLENLLLEYQEEATTKWSSYGERLEANIKYEVVSRIIKEIDDG